MIRTRIVPCSLPKETADAFNQESGRQYTAVLVEHYRVYRHTGNWLSPRADQKLGDFMAGETILHAHSRDAAQEGFPKACKTARACRSVGLDTHYPHKRKSWRTTIWKSTGIRHKRDQLLLAKARGLEPVSLTLPDDLLSLPPEAFVEVRLVWDRAARHYFWHLVLENGLSPAPPPGEETAGVDPGEIHPITVSDGQEAVVFSARQLRSVRQHTNKRLSELQALQARKIKGSKRWRRLQREKHCFLAKQKRRKRDIEHKVSRAVVDWAVERKVGTLALGDVRDAADEVNLGKKNNQKIASWDHGKIRKDIEYKAQAAGIATVLVDEAYTSQTCPNCGERHKPKGRIYRCPACGFVSHRDAVGAANIRSVWLYGVVGRSPPGEVKYRHPFNQRASVAARHGASGSAI